MDAPTRHRIFAAARAQFDEAGASAVSMRKVAAAVGITPMAIYRHYPDKDALLDALMLDGMAAWEARARAIDAVEPLEWLERFAFAFMDFALCEPRRYEAAFLMPASRARRYPEDFLAGRSPAINLAYERIERAKVQGLIGDAPTEEIVLTLSALAQGLVSMHQAGRFTSEAEFREAYRSAIRRWIASFKA